MRLTEQNRRDALAAILAALDSTPCDRRSLLDAVVRELAPESKKSENRLRSYIGSRIDALVSEGRITLSDGLYRAGEPAAVIIRASECRESVLKALSRRPMSGASLKSLLAHRLGTGRTPTKQDDRELDMTVDATLAELEASGLVRLGEKGYMRVCPHPTPSLDEFRDLLFSRLHEMGGGFFERFVAGALEAYYLQTGRTVTYCDVTGGASDGGIDVVVDTVDGLGFTEHILVQTKCRSRIHTTEKEIREFYGAMHAQEGSRGIFVTAAAFHPGAQRLLDSLPNCVGIDGDKLFSILLKTGYGIQKTPDGYACDESVFALA